MIVERIKNIDLRYRFKVVIPNKAPYNSILLSDVEDWLESTLSNHYFIASQGLLLLESEEDVTMFLLRWQ